MGGDIAAWRAAGLNVTLQDRELKFIEPALVRARDLRSASRMPAKRQSS
jgi:3-hydroxyacyl-CoA dehydrogenase/enoyl-CoA hydratase/3-hydroxybutyryl-CoA epimerase